MSSRSVEWEDSGIRMTGAARSGLSSSKERKQKQSFWRDCRSCVGARMLSPTLPSAESKQDPDSRSRFLSKSSVKRRLWLRSSTVVLDMEWQSGAICCSVNTGPEKAQECLCSGSWSARSAGGQGRWYTSEWRLTSQH